MSWLKHEIEILRILDHPNIMKLFEIYEDEKRYYLVSELCSGVELFELIQNSQQMNEHEAAKIIM